MPSDRLNVLLIVIDSARFDRFGCYGYPRGTTPSMDSLARQGIVFERMIAPAPWTVPSHASLFTGLYSREHGADRPALKMRLGLLHLGQHLAGCGYETVFVSNNPLVSKRTGLLDGAGRVLLRRHFDRDFNRPWVRRLRTLLARSDSGAAATNRIVAELFQTLSPPFFIFINYMECHWKYSPPLEFEERFVRSRPYSRLHSALYRMRIRRRYSWENERVGDEKEIALLSDLFDASLACVDSRIGDLLEALDRSGRGGETVVIVTADHGENIGDHGLFGHGMCLYQNVLRVPFIVRIPGRKPERVGGLVQLTDVFAGLCRLLDIEVPGHLRERRFSVDPFELKAGQPGRVFAFGEWHQWEGEMLRKRLERAPHFKSPPSTESAQDDRYKLIVEVSSGKEMLFDLQQDPAEIINRIGELGPQRDRLAAALAEWRRVFQPAGTEAVYTPEEERIVEARMRELGYL